MKEITLFDKTLTYYNSYETLPTKEFQRIMREIDLLPEYATEEEIICIVLNTKDIDLIYSIPVKIIDEILFFRKEQIKVKELKELQILDYNVIIEKCFTDNIISFGVKKELQQLSVNATSAASQIINNNTDLLKSEFDKLTDEQKQIINNYNLKINEYFLLNCEKSAALYIYDFINTGKKWNRSLLFELEKAFLNMSISDAYSVAFFLIQNIGIYQNLLKNILVAKKS